MTSLFDLLSRARVFDLAQPYYAGMPHFPTHPPFLFGLVKLHGEQVGPAGHSSASDALALGTHNGTHMDALCHFSVNGRLHGGAEVAPLQSYIGGLRQFSIDTVEPVLRRGVLLDIARLEGTASLPADYEITAERMEAAAAAQGVEVRPGDVVLLRTGWALYWGNAARFLNQLRSPGPALGAAEWLSSRSIFAAGSDTAPFEKMPAEAMPVHVHLLVESGIHIIECLNLEELAAARVSEFVFVAAPLKVRGATGAPVRPLAIVAG